MEKLGPGGAADAGADTKCGGNTRNTNSVHGRNSEWTPESCMDTTITESQKTRNTKMKEQR